MKSGPDQMRDWAKRRHLETQADIAKHFGWQESFISQLLNGKRTPGLENAIRIERETGIPVEAWVSSEVQEPTGETAATVPNTLVHKT